MLKSGLAWYHTYDRLKIKFELDLDLMSGFTKADSKNVPCDQPTSATMARQRAAAYLGNRWSK